MLCTPTKPSFFMQTKQYQQIPSCAQDDFFPHYPVLSVCRAVTKRNYFCILGYRIGTSEMYLTEDFLAWLSKEQKGWFNLLYTFISSSSASIKALCHAWLQGAIYPLKSPTYNFKIRFLAWHQRKGSIGSLGWEPFHRGKLQGSARRSFTYKISALCFPIFQGRMESSYIYFKHAMTLGIWSKKLY